MLSCRHSTGIGFRQGSPVVPIAFSARRCFANTFSSQNKFTAYSSKVGTSDADNSTFRGEFGSGDPHMPTREDFQTSVTGSDEMKAGEAAPRAFAALVDDAANASSAQGRESDRVDPEQIPRSKFGSGDPHTQTSLDTRGMVAGGDEIKAGEAVPKAVADLVRDVEGEGTQ